jgi:CheY-like chemotaxis protein
MLMMYVIISGRADKKIIQEKEESNVLLAAAAEKAESASIAKSEFLSRMSHDIRTPINAIMGMTGIAFKNIDNKERARDCLLKIESASQHLLSLINDVLDMSRIESGKITLLNEPFCLGTCLSNCVTIIEGQIASRELELVTDFGDFENTYVIGDELHLRQVFINILGNSVKFTPDGGKIFFIAEKYDSDGKNAFRFILKDTGIGMKPDFIPHLFEPFTQENGGSRTNYNGTGLGMAIVKQIVDMMGGTIAVESAINAGTTFYIIIPMEIDTEKRENPTENDGNFNLDGMKILLAEDNELNREIAVEILSEQGVNVTIAKDGKEAVELFERSEDYYFDAILMDIMMPIMDGLTATKIIRNCGKAGAEDIPIIAMTANAYNEDREKTREAGMDSHLSKPIDVCMLYRTLSVFYRNPEKRR